MNNTTKNSPTGVLNDGNQPRVARNWHDRSHDNVLSIATGFEVPTLCEWLQGNSTVKLDINCALQTQPTLSPVFADVYVNNLVVFCPLRLYVPGLYGNNYLEADVIENISFPTLYSEYSSPVDSFPTKAHAILQGSLLAHLRYPRVFSFGLPVDERLWITNRAVTEVEYSEGSFSYPRSYKPVNFREYNALPVLAYFDACLHYVVDPYDKSIPFEMTEFVVGYNSDSDPSIPDFSLDVQRFRIAYDYDDLLNLVYEAKGIKTGTSYLDNGLQIDGDPQSASVLPVLSSFLDLPVELMDSSVETGFYFKLNDWNNSPSEKLGFQTIGSYVSHEGLFPVTFAPDYFTTFYDDDQVNKLYQISFSDGSYMGLRLAQADYNRTVNAIIRGQKYDDWDEATYGVNLKLSDHPIRLGSDSFRVSFKDIVNQNSGAERFGNPVPLGTAVARGYAAQGLKEEYHFTTLEPGILFVLTSAVPAVQYSADVPIHNRYLKMGDLPNRYYDGATFQNTRFGEMIHTGSSYISLDDYSIGSVPIFYEDMISHDRVSGLLATEAFGSYTFTRDFGPRGFLDGVTLNDDDDITPAAVLDFARSKYVNGANYDYQFAASSPIFNALGDTAASENYFLYMHFQLRVLEPLTNQVISRASM